jgi:hypothetical protein
MQNNTIPQGTEAVIIAEFMIDKSDPMTDYYGGHADQTKTAILAFSTTTRENFNEMKKAALNCPETAHMTNAKENRQNYSMGGGYFLGERYRGWKIRKMPLSFSFTLPLIKEIIANGRNFAPAATIREAGKMIEGTEIRVNTELGGIEIYFAQKPSPAVLADLKVNGWRWSNKNKCWYKKDSPRVREFAAKFGEFDAARGDEKDQGGYLLDAMNDEYSDNWAATNL